MNQKRLQQKLYIEIRKVSGGKKLKWQKEINEITELSMQGFAYS